MSDKRVFLVKRGDTLVFGNVGCVDDEAMPDLLAALKESLGLAQVIVFEDDIDMAQVPGA
jgi:hypothetical protein